MIANIEFVIEGLDADINSILHRNTSRTMSLPVIPKPLKKTASLLSLSSSLNKSNKREKHLTKQKIVKKRVEILQNQITIEVIKKNSLMERLSYYESISPNTMVELPEIYYKTMTQEIIEQTNELLEENHRLSESLEKQNEKLKLLSSNTTSRYSQKLEEQNAVLLELYY